MAKQGRVRLLAFPYLPHLFFFGSLAWARSHTSRSAVGKWERLRAERHCTDCRDREQRQAYYAVWRDAHQKAAEEGVYPLGDVNAALFASLSMPFDEIVSSRNPIIRGIGILDKRFGKRRLADFDAEKEHPLVRSSYEFRCSAEGMTVSRQEASDNDQPESPPANGESGK